MSDKPSYLGLLNAIAVGESEAEGYLNAWASTTEDDGVRHVISSVALREGEHGKSFAKRIGELGYRVRPREGSDATDKMAVACSTELSDREKFERLGLASRVPKGNDSEPGDDIFSRMFRDPTIDIQTGALLGRYIAEERDSGRMLKACYRQLCATDETSHAGGGNGGAPTPVNVTELTHQLSRIEALLEQLVAQGDKSAKPAKPARAASR